MVILEFEEEASILVELAAVASGLELHHLDP
jgi:hypothetical protein